MTSQVRLGSHLGRLGRLGERQGRVWAPTEPREERAVHATLCGPERGGLRRLQKPYQTALGILARLNVPGGTVADILKCSDNQLFWKDFGMRARRRAHVARMVLFDTDACTGRMLDQRECTAK